MSSAKPSSPDFFPLAIGNSWTYDYSVIDNQQAGDAYITESGSAIYTVLSNAVSTDSMSGIFAKFAMSCIRTPSCLIAATLCLFSRTQSTLTSSNIAQGTIDFCGMTRFPLVGHRFFR